MGKGDKKTTKGKRTIGSHGITRPKKKSSTVIPAAKTEKPAKETKEAPAKEAAAKKEPAKKPAAKKAAPKAEKVEEKTEE